MHSSTHFNFKAYENFYKKEICLFLFNTAFLKITLLQYSLIFPSIQPSMEYCIRNFLQI